MQSLDSRILPTSRIRLALPWWVTSSSLESGTPFLPMVWKVLLMDARLLGWGGVLGTLLV